MVGTDVSGDAVLGDGESILLRDKAETLLRLLWHRADSHVHVSDLQARTLLSAAPPPRSPRRAYIGSSARCQRQMRTLLGADACWSRSTLGTCLLSPVCSSRSCVSVTSWQVPTGTRGSYA